MFKSLQWFCANCHEPFKGIARYRDIGPPFTICPRCEYVERYDHITEWDLKNRRSKLGYLGIIAWSAFLVGFGPLFVYRFVVESVLGERMDRALVLPIALFGILGCALWLGLRFMMSVRRSRERMSDPAYRETLVRLGFLPE